MTDAQGTQISVGPYRLSFAEYMSVLWAARTSTLYKVYSRVICALLAMALQLSLWGIFVLGLWIAIGPLSPGWVIGSVIVAGVISVLLVLRVIGQAVMRRQFAGLASSKYDFTVHLRDAGVSYTCGKISSQLPWDAVDRVADKRGCILVFFDDLSALVVPRRAFATAADADAFLSFARTCRDASR